MGIALISQLIFTFILFLGILIGACVIIGHAGRPEKRGIAFAIVLTLGFMTLVVSTILGEQFMFGGSTLTESNWTKRYCDNAGEEIFKTVENVHGVFYQPPKIPNSYSRFHENDADPRAYLSRPDRAYDFFETRRHAGELVEHHELKDKKIAFNRRGSPASRYAFTWSPITSRQDRQSGVHGEELEVFDGETGEVLGRRVLFYYTSRRAPQPLLMPLPLCPKSSLPLDTAYLDGQPRDSYKFVAKILKPPVRVVGNQADEYDLFRGSGYRRKSCVGFIRIGRGISPKDLSFYKSGHDLHIKIRSTEDVLNCESRATAATPPDPYAPFKFADGHIMEAREFYSRIRPVPEKAN